MGLQAGGASAGIGSAVKFGVALEALSGPIHPLFQEGCNVTKFWLSRVSVNAVQHLSKYMLL